MRTAGQGDAPGVEGACPPAADDPSMGSAAASPGRPRGGATPFASATAGGAP